MAAAAATAPWLHDELSPKSRSPDYHSPMRWQSPLARSPLALSPLTRGLHHKANKQQPMGRSPAAKREAEDDDLPSSPLVKSESRPVGRFTHGTSNAWLGPWARIMLRVIVVVAFVCSGLIYPALYAIRGRVRIDSPWGYTLVILDFVLWVDIVCTFFTPGWREGHHALSCQAHTNTSS